MSILIILLLLAVLAFAALAASYHIGFRMTAKQRKAALTLSLGEEYDRKYPTLAEGSRKMMAEPYEPVRITAWDGTELFARYYHVADGAPLEIQFHGYRGNPYRDFSGGHALSMAAGHNSLLVDQRAHGESGGSTICFGIRARKDCLDWANYARRRFGDVPILLSGLSMGAATVLMAADLPLPETVVGIIADCPYSAPSEIIYKVCGEDMKLPAKLAYPVAKLAARLFGGLDLDESSALQSVANTKLPILILHGEADRFVPCDMSRAVAAVNPACVQLETFPDAGHGMSFVLDPARYRSVVHAFYRRVGV